MNDQWRPKTVEVKKHFEKAHDAREPGVPPPLPQNQNERTPPPLPPITQDGLKKLETKLARMPQKIDHVPGGARPNDAARKHLEKQIARIRERFQEKKEELKRDFDRSAQRDR